MTEYEAATIAATLTSALIEACGRIAAAHTPPTLPAARGNHQLTVDAPGLTPAGAVAIYQDVLAELTSPIAG